jgi:hypothetical protein
MIVTMPVMRGVERERARESTKKFHIYRLLQNVFRRTCSLVK